MLQFVDRVTIKVLSGDGGNGAIAWRKEKYEPSGGPAGGNGGKGGDIYLEATESMSTLMDFRYNKIFSAATGARGGPKSKNGHKGQNLVIKVPVGTTITDADNLHVIADLIQPGQRVLVAEGGAGGRGNAVLATPTRRAPHFCEPGQPGIERKLILELKLIADVGLIGLPNAGKSSLLAKITAASPKIAAYPFSTLTPNLGVVKTDNNLSYVIADIPGLVEGAWHGSGLGHHFLRHIERTRLLIHVVDMGAADPWANIATVVNELKQYNPGLCHLPQLLVFNKSDLVADSDRRALLEQLKSKINLAPEEPFKDILVISCATGQGIKELCKQLFKQLSQLKYARQPQQPDEDPKARQHPEAAWAIRREKGSFFIDSNHLNRLVSITDMRDPESVHHFNQVFKSMGLVEALIQAGCLPNSHVIIGKQAFTFGQDFG